MTFPPSKIVLTLVYFADWSAQVDMQRKRSRHLFGDEIAAALAVTDATPGQDAHMRELQGSGAMQGMLMSLLVY